MRWMCFVVVQQSLVFVQECFVTCWRTTNIRTVGQFAEWVAEYVFRNQMELWGEQMEAMYEGTMYDVQRGMAASLLALLPNEFTAADLIKLRARKGQSVKSAAICMVINRWKNNHRIIKINETTWRKTNY